MFGLSTSDIIVVVLFIASVLFVIWIRGGRFRKLSGAFNASSGAARRTTTYVISELHLIYYSRPGYLKLWPMMTGVNGVRPK